ncbi:hypothetical protein EST38_g11478 [Candolleomyces aberdarensis]|uniref:Uncharacterized protein n=1 Tax=Candolleomyces aberdarensis TaxID=2316362 RepID=A0A4Q2D731_9AGAR|nr:hypothetical protein EST38_g11478 [Candolleomyces aberdarensis]
MARAEIAMLKKEVERVKLSEVRGKEPKGMQMFLAEADTLSVTDFVEKVDTLNEERN